MPTHSTLSLREQLKQAVVEFLDGEGMMCARTRDGLVMLINALGHYREEGKALFPEIFVFNSLKDVLDVLPESEHVHIGEDAKQPATMAKALKKCAPLARRGWAVFIERNKGKFRYGLFRSGSNILSLSPARNSCVHVAAGRRKCDSGVRFFPLFASGAFWRNQRYRGIATAEAH